MTQKHHIRETVIRSLSAIGAVHDAEFYAELFAQQEPHKFALLVVDGRCLRNPLLETLIGSLRLLADLDLYPTLLIGAFGDNDVTNIKYQSHRLVKDLSSVSMIPVCLNTGSYGLAKEITKTAKNHKITILEHTGEKKAPKILSLVQKLAPSKVIFLQPSGGLTRNSKRVPVINIDTDDQSKLDNPSKGQARFLEFAKEMCLAADNQSTYVIASPLNLMQELFTTKGSGTLVRRGADIRSYNNFRGLKVKDLKSSMENAFEKKLISDPKKWPIQNIILEQDLRGGAIVTELADMPYLSKFWVTKAAQGEGIARDIWDVLIRETDYFFWRSRMNNAFNNWYLARCDGMQIEGDWRVFWKGIEPANIPIAVEAAANAPSDFKD